MSASVLGFSLPVFVIGYILIQIFAIDLKLLPVQGFRSIFAGLWPFLERAILPALTVSTIYIALIARMTRARCWTCSARIMSAPPAPRG